MGLDVKPIGGGEPAEYDTAPPEPIFSKAYADELARRFCISSDVALHLVRQVVLDYLENETTRMVADIKHRLERSRGYVRDQIR